MNINKICAILTHIIACGVLIASIIMSYEVFKDTIPYAIFCEAVAIYFNTSK